MQPYETKLNKLDTFKHMILKLMASNIKTKPISCLLWDDLIFGGRGTRGRKGGRCHKSMIDTSGA